MICERLAGIIGRAGCIASHRARSPQETVSGILKVGRLINKRTQN